MKARRPTPVTGIPKAERRGFDESIRMLKRIGLSREERRKMVVTSQKYLEKLKKSENESKQK